jgi:hypothetical protein
VFLEEWYLNARVLECRPERKLNLAASSAVRVPIDARNTPRCFVGN